MNNIDIEQMIYTAAIFRNTNVREIARSLGVTSSNLYRKISKNTLKSWELSKIAEVLGGQYVFYFSFSNGTKIGKLEKPKSANRKNNKSAAVRIV